MNLTVRVYYIRHGQSVWNAEQAQMRASGQLTEEEIKAKGGSTDYTDSPLSAHGVGQALELRRLLFPDAVSAHERWLERPDTLGKYLRCAMRGSCRPARLLTSNLRRAIATLLLALRPALDSPAFAAPGVVLVPALQETCSHADCTPMPRSADGRILKPLPSPHASMAHAMEAVAADDREAAGHVLRLEAQALHLAALSGREQPGVPPPQGEGWRAFRALAQRMGLGPAPPPPAPGAFTHNAFLRATYETHLTLAPHARYDDRRRVAHGALGACGHEPAACGPPEREEPDAALAAALRDFMERASDVLSLVFGGGEPKGAAATSNDTLVVTAHSRLLREILLIFRTHQTAP
eukprot:4804311-Prymnesium_polylepis.1